MFTFLCEALSLSAIAVLRHGFFLLRVPVQCGARMLYVYLAFGLPLARPATRSSIHCFSRLSPSLLAMCPKYIMFVCSMVFTWLLGLWTLSSTLMSVVWSCHLMFSIRLQHQSSKLEIVVFSFCVNVHVSNPYNAMLKTSALISLISMASSSDIGHPMLLFLFL